MIPSIVAAQQGAEAKRQDAYLGTSAPSVAILDTADDAAEPAEHCAFCPYPRAQHESLRGWPRLRLALHQLVDDPESSRAARVCSYIVIGLIVVSTVTLCLETLPRIDESGVWFVFEAIVSVLFAVEYAARLLASGRRCAWFVQPLNVVDLVAFLPFFVQLATSASGLEALRVLRVARLLRVLRVLKLSRQLIYMQLMARALEQSADAFGLLFFFLSLAVVVLSTLLYYAERDATRDNDGPFTSIPACFYWAVVTMTTVGYGDNVPTTPLGKFVAGLTMLCGILCVALPVSILGNNFQEVYQSHFAEQASQAHAAHGGALSRRRVLVDKQLAKVQACREEIARALVQTRLILEDRNEVVSIANVWQTVDQVIVGGLVRLQDFIAKLELPEERQEREQHEQQQQQHRPRQQPQHARSLSVD
jgi:hypothetical protein